MNCAYGAVSYTLRGVVHRPGALTPKLTGSRNVTIVVSPAEDDTELTHSIAIERQWESQLRYIISLGSRNVVIGSTIPFSLTFVPLDKCKIYRLSVFLEEKFSYRITKGQANKELPVRRVELLSLKHPHRANAPILPIDPDQADALKPYVETSSSTASFDEAFTSLMGPGPWILSHMLHLPSDCSSLHFSFKHRTVNMIISHSLKIVFRVEGANDQAIESGTSKRRQFDIIIQIPLRILSCYCNTALSSLPRYTLASDNVEFPNAITSHNGSSTGHSPRPVQVSPIFHNERSHMSSTSERTSMDFLHNAIQFSRLVAGQESTLGDAPPEYRDVV
ncbi:hypothetical protein Clacol_002829 [Clathrus columnatus]|uniref:Arrestin C-terminal-like domain-containing protein n=1 Tax=Clathrus columnatus TaxID=1419009 RepID=A0AAV5A2Y5_9AGAM|nr:hypothetical protein Clacol_002829 [Clathrus columnatus]